MLVLTRDEQSRRMVTCHDNKVLFSFYLILISNKRGADMNATVHEFHKMATVNLCSVLTKGIRNEEAVHSSIDVCFFDRE